PESSKAQGRRQKALGGLWPLAFGLWSLVFVLCAWCLALGALYFVLSTWCQPCQERSTSTRHKAQSSKYKVQSTKAKGQRPKPKDQSLPPPFFFTFFGFPCQTPARNHFRTRDQRNTHSDRLGGRPCFEDSFA